MLFNRYLGLLSICIAVVGAQLTPKIVLTNQNFGCALVDDDGNALVETQPGPFVIWCLYPNNLLCPYSTDFGGGSTTPGCPATGFLKCPGCQPRDFRGSSNPLVCPLVGPGQALLTFGEGGRDSSIKCHYGPGVKCIYDQDGTLDTSKSHSDCQTTAVTIPAAACPTRSSNHPRPSCRPW